MRQGDLVVANVRLERLLSEGGMGSVWVADHLTLSTQVAVKFMGADMTNNADALARFKREASAAAQIKSPHIVQVFDHGVTADGVPYIVMELLHGEDLEHRLDRGPISLADALLVIRHLCKALGRAHQQGIVHRDIKPANLFLVEADGDVFVKVLDFGIAKRTSVGDALTTSKTQSGTMMGTPAYMSPEQIMGAPDLDARCDLWAASVVAYACVTGTVPFDGETIGALAVSINAARFIPVTSRLPGLPSSLDAWFERALARSIGDRFQSAKELSDAFANAVPKEMWSLRPGSDASFGLPPDSLAPRSQLATVDLRLGAHGAAKSPGDAVPVALAVAVPGASPGAHVSPPSARIRALDAVAEEPQARRSLFAPVAIAGAFALVLAGAVVLFGHDAAPPHTSAGTLASSPTTGTKPEASGAPPAAVDPPAVLDAPAVPAAPAASVRLDGAESADAADARAGVAAAASAPAGAPGAGTFRSAAYAEVPRKNDSASHRVPFGVLAVPELPQIAGSKPPPPPPAPAPQPPRADPPELK